MSKGRTWTSVGLALIVACVLAAPVAAQEKIDPQELYKAILTEGVKNPSQFLRSLKGDLPLGESRPIDPMQYGGNTAFMVIPVSRFQPFTSNFSVTTASDGVYKRALGDNGLILEAPLELQPGTEVQQVCTFWHDTDATNDGGFEGLAAVSANELPSDNTTIPNGQAFSITGVTPTGAPGYVVSCQQLNPTFTVRSIADLDDADALAHAVAYSFVVIVDFSPQADVSFGGAGIFFRRLITPTPATDFFDDVPVGHQQHQYVEALRISAITSGCSVSPPLYCPDAPLTRGQMAVFLSRIVGLWWPF